MNVVRTSIFLFVGIIALATLARVQFDYSGRIDVVSQQSTTPAVVSIPAPGSPFGRSTTSTEVLVIRTIDGDTIGVEGGERVRYIGIDTPELAHGKQLLECFGNEATTYNENLVLGKRVTLVRDVSDRDTYGRLLRYVFVGDTLVNKALVEGGFAYATSYPPDISRQETLREAEREARASKRGLWGTCQ